VAVRDALKEGCRQGARGRVQLQLGQKRREKAPQAAAVQGCKAPTLCTASEE